LEDPTAEELGKCKGKITDWVGSTAGNLSQENLASTLRGMMICLE